MLNNMSPAIRCALHAHLPAYDDARACVFHHIACSCIEKRQLRSFAN